MHPESLALKLSSQPKHQSLSIDKPLLGSNHSVLPTRLISCSSRLTCWYVLVAIIGRITGAGGTCIVSTVGTAGTAVGIPVTGAPNTSCSNLGEWDRYHGQVSPSLRSWALLHSAFIPANASPHPSGPTAPYGTTSQPSEDLEATGLSGFYFSYLGPYRAISASISFKRSSPLLPGMPTPGPGTTGPPATGSPGAGPAPAIADAMAFTALSSSRRGFYSRAPVVSGWEQADDVWTTATDALREDVV